MGSCISFSIKTAPVKIKVSPPVNNRVESPTLDAETAHSASVSPLGSRRVSTISINEISSVELQFEHLARSYVGHTYHEYVKINKVLGLECYQSSVIIGRVDNFHFILPIGEHILFTLKTSNHFDSDSDSESVNEFITNNAKQCTITEVDHIVIK